MPAGPNARPMRVELLGTAQDGGVPHLDCGCARCERARADPAARRYPASLLVEADSRLLVDASMDLRHQLHGGVDGALVTHAHVGHLPGLLQFGHEVAAADDLPVYCTPALAELLADHEPFAHLVAGGHLDPVPVAAGRSIPPPDSPVTTFRVPHRDELGVGTLGVRVSGERDLVYVPDVDEWTPEVVDRVREADVALVDGTFWSADEVPGRGEVAHPPVRRSLDRLPVEETDVRFVHLNHMNPLLDPESPESEEVRRRGAAIARRGDVIEL